MEFRSVETIVRSLNAAKVQYLIGSAGVLHGLLLALQTLFHETSEWLKAAETLIRQMRAAQARRDAGKHPSNS